MAYLPPAAPDGLGASYGDVGKGRASAGILAAFGIALVAVGWWAAVFAGVAALVGMTLGWLAWKRIQGYTGDVLGAVEQLAEIALLVTGAALVSAAAGVGGVVGLSRTLHLVRHGATTWSETGRLCGWSDIPLSDRGREQAGALRQTIEARSFAGIWTSDLCRASEFGGADRYPGMARQQTEGSRLR